MSPDSGLLKARTEPQELWSAIVLLSKFQGQGATVEYIEEKERHTRIIETASTHARTGYIDDDGEWKTYLKEAMIFEITDDGEQGKKNAVGEKVEMGHYLKSHLAAVRMQFPDDMLCQIGGVDLMDRKVGNHTLAHIATMVGIPHFPQRIRRLALAAKVHGEHNSSVQKMMRGLRA